MANEQTLLEAAEAEIRAQLDAIALRRVDPVTGFDGKLQMATAALTRSLVTCQAEQRQQERARRKAISDIPLDQIVEFLRGLPEAKRLDVCRRVSGAADEEGLF